MKKSAIILIVLCICSSFLYASYAETLDTNHEELVTGESQKLTVTEGGTLFVFQPQKDGNYLFKHEIVQKIEDNIGSNFSPIKMELLDSDKKVLFHNKGNVGDIYKDSYNKGGAVIIAQGGDPDEAKYYEGFRYDCLAGEKYYMKLDIPEEDRLTASEKELYGKDFKVSRELDLEVIYSGEIKAGKGQDQEKDKGGNTGVIILVVAAAAIVLLLIVKAKGKRESVSQNQEVSTAEQPADAKHCSECGKALEGGAKFCNYCGTKQDE